MIFPDQLIIDDLVGHRIAIDPGRQVTLGRASDFVIGEDDDYMHRLFLHFWDRDGAWMVTNRGTRLVPRIVQQSRAAHSQLELSPGASAPLPLGTSAVVFSTPTMTYEISVIVAQTLVTPENVVSGEFAKVTTGAFNPNDEQVALLKALAAPLLRSPGADDSTVPTVRQVADQLGWTQKKVNTKIDYLCSTLEKNGFGSFSGKDGLATPRRIPLARFAVSHYNSL